MTAPDHDFTEAVDRVIYWSSRQPADPPPRPIVPRPTYRADARRRRTWRERLAHRLGLGDLHQLGRHRRARQRMGAAAARSRGATS